MLLGRMARSEVRLEVQHHFLVQPAAVEPAAEPAAAVDTVPVADAVCKASLFSELQVQLVNCPQQSEPDALPFVSPLYLEVPGANLRCVSSVKATSGSGWDQEIPSVADPC